MSSRRRLHSVLLLGLTAAALSHCRQVSLCGAANPSCRPDASAGSAGALIAGTDGALAELAGQGGVPELSSAGEAGLALGGSIEHEAGAAGQAGEASELECPKPHANCDATSLNGCETNLSLDPNHCGACNTPCDGLCVSSSCLGFEVAGNYGLQSNLAISDQFLYFVTGEGFTSERLMRVDSLSKKAETLAQNLLDFDRVAVGADRVYLWSDTAGLWSVLNGSHLLVDEGIQLEWFGVNREYSFWLDFPTLHRRRIGAAPSEQTAWRELRDARPSDLAVDESELVFLQHGDPDRISRFALYQDAPTQPELLVSEKGEIVRFRLYENELYWVTRYTEGVLEHDELHRLSLLDSGTPELLLSAPRIENFAVNGWVFAYRPALPYFEIQALHPARPNQIYRLGTLAMPSLMEADGQGRLWIFESELSRVLSSDVSWLE